jgi:hypothetical protein
MDLRRALALVSCLALSCRARPADDAAPIDVTPTVTVFPSAPVAGRPLLVRYRWTTGARFDGLPRPYRAFVHFVSEDGAEVVNDDHAPSPPTTAWTAGRTYEYSRFVFTHRQFPGRYEVRLGLYDPEDGQRVPLDGEALGRREYRVARLAITPGVDARPRFGRGFFPPEASARRPFDAMHWMGPEGVLDLPNPKADAVLFIRAWTDRPAFDSAPTITMSVGAAATKHTVADGEPFVLALRVPKAALGDGDWASAALWSDRHFTPPPPQTRTLAVCVEAAALVPEAQLAAELRAAVEESRP